MIPDASIYLFGSRINDKAAGGDIDLLLLTDKKVSSTLLRIFKREFYKKFGWQKVDIVNFRHNENNAFKSVIMDEAIPLI